MLTDNMYQEKKAKEDLPALKTVLTHRYDLKTKWRSTDYSHQKQYWQHKDLLNENNLKTKIGKENNSVDVLNG